RNHGSSSPGGTRSHSSGAMQIPSVVLDAGANSAPMPGVRLQLALPDDEDGRWVAFFEAAAWSGLGYEQVVDGRYASGKLKRHVRDIEWWSPDVRDVDNGDLVFMDLRP